MKKPSFWLVSSGVLVALLVWYWQRRQHKLPYLEPSLPATSAQRSLGTEEPASSESVERKKQAVKMPEILPSERNTPIPMPHSSQQPSAVPMPSVDPSRDGTTKLVAFGSQAEQATESLSAVAEPESDEPEIDQQQPKPESKEQESDQQQTKPESKEQEPDQLSAEQEAELLQQAEEQREAAAASAQADQSKQAKRLNPNTASLQELIDLPGIGPVLAKRIIEYRDAHGLFKTIDDLVEIQGIGPNNIRQFDFLLAIDEDDSDQ